MKVGEKVKFDHMGEEHTGVIICTSSVNVGSKSHNIVQVKSDNHTAAISINITLFPERIRHYKKPGENYEV
mgnify:CR=1 FL=1